MPENIAKFRHHGQHKVAPHMADGLDTLATHLLHGAQYMFDARPHFGDFMVAPLLAFGQRVVATAFPLDTTPVA